MRMDAQTANEKIHIFPDGTGSCFSVFCDFIPGWSSGHSNASVFTGIPLRTLIRSEQTGVFGFGAPSFISNGIALRAHPYLNQEPDETHQAFKPTLILNGTGVKESYS